MTVLPSGMFQMGSADGPASERPVHRVTIASRFALGQSAVTFAEWDACVAAGGCAFRPSDHGWGRGDRPAIGLSYADAQAYADWLSTVTGERYRMPSEAEWEYADRAGTTTAYWWGDEARAGVADCSDCEAEARRMTMPIRTYPPNAFGLYDTAGNVAEWVADCWTPNYADAPSDGSAVTTANCAQHTLRGGNFSSDIRALRSAARFKYDTNVRYYTNGVRVARDIR
jgi:formylglycine-generating enzyme required for sulfatase activity